MERGVYFDAWMKHNHCYHPSLPLRSLEMIEERTESLSSIIFSMELDEITSFSMASKNAVVSKLLSSADILPRKYASFLIAS